MENVIIEKETKISSSSLIRVIAYAIPSIGIALILGPVSTVLGGVYAKYFGLSLTTIATAMLIARVFDAITDPVIGFYSDSWYMRTGSRKPLMLIGAIFLVISSYFLLVPSADFGSGYFIFWYLSFYLSLTIFVVPYLAWINEFTINVNEKTLAYSAYSIANQSGTGLFYLIPLLPFFSSTEITPQVLKFSVTVSAAILIPSVILALKFVPNGPSPERPVVPSSAGAGSLFHEIIAVVSAMKNNQPFIIFVAAFMFFGAGIGMWSGMFFIYVDSYLKLGEAFAEVSLWGILCGLLAIPIWYKFVLIVGKRQAWLVGMAILVVVFFLTSFLSPAGTGVYELLALNILMVFASASMGVITVPMLCDVIDYGRLKDHVHRNAVYFSVYTLLTKMQIAVGSALGLGIAGWFGFDMFFSVQNPPGLLGLHIGASWLPAVFLLIAMFFIALMPLDEERMILIRRRLAARDGRLNVGGNSE